VLAAAGWGWRLDVGLGRSWCERAESLEWEELTICLGFLGKPWASSCQMRRNSSSKCSRGVFWVRKAAGLHAPPLSIPLIPRPCPIASSQQLSKSL